MQSKCHDRRSSRGNEAGLDDSPQTLFALMMVAWMLAMPCEFARAQSPASRDWPVWNGNANGDHYSPLAQIDRQSVAKLRVAWTFDTGEEGGLETNPLVIAGVVYANTPSRKVVALDAVTGRLFWKFD